MAKEKSRSEETTQLIRKINFLEKWHSLLMQVYMISAIILTIYSVCNFGLPSTILYIIICSIIGRGMVELFDLIENHIYKEISDLYEDKQ